MANTIAKSCTVQPKVARFDRPALCFFYFFIFFAKGKENSVLDFSRGIPRIAQNPKKRNGSRV